MKLNWIVVSLISGIVIGIVTYILTQSWEIGLITGTFVTAAVMINNPIRRYMKAFWALLGTILILNRFYFTATGKVEEFDFVLGSKEATDTVTVALVVLAAMALLLDHFERNGTLKGHFLQISSNKNSIGKITGNNTVHQSVNISPPKQEIDE